MYLSFKQYTDMGGELAETTFNLYYNKVEAKINFYTFNRFTKETEFPDELKNCIITMINMFVSIDNGVETSENFINYTQEQITSMFEDTIKEYLSRVEVNGVPCLYRGA